MRNLRNSLAFWIGFSAVTLLWPLLTGCATYRPIVDLASSPGKSAGSYEHDLTECQQYADQVSPGTGAAIGAGAGVVIGAVFGGAVAAILGGDIGENMALGAAVGGMGGGLGGAGSGAQSQIDIIRRCMTARGYTVLQ